MRLGAMLVPMLSPMLGPMLSPMLGPRLAPMLSSMLASRLSPLLAPRLSSLLAPRLSPLLAPRLSPLLAPRLSPLLAPRLSSMLSWMLSWILGPMQRRTQNIGSRRRGLRPLRVQRLAHTPDPDRPACTQMHGGQKWFRCARTRTVRSIRAAAKRFALIRYRDAGALESCPRRRRQDGESQQFG
jgi:hypothetical protein